MCSVHKDNTPILVVYGKTRVGKGEYISTAVRSLTGDELAITSTRIRSDTKTARGYPSKLNGMDIVFYDTVGFGDSDCTNLAEDTLLRTLEATGTQPFYPPLYILKDLDSNNIDALKKLTSIFPEVCVAVRGSQEAFKTAPNDFEDAELQIFRIFHLPEYLSDMAETRGPYDDAVSRILDAYSSFTPTRQDLKFDSKLFEGKIEKLIVNTQTKSEDQVFEECYTVTETQIVTKERVEEEFVGLREVNYEFPPANEMFANAEAFFKNIFEWIGSSCGEKKKVPVYKTMIVKDEVPVEVELSRRKTTKTRFVYSRDIFDLYKVLSGNIRIYMRNEEGEWTEKRQEIIEVRDVKVR